MRETVGTIKDKFRRIDPVLLVATTVLSLMSIVVLIGARNSAYGSTRTIVMQAAMTVTGIIIMFLLSAIDFSSLHPAFYIVTVIVSIGFILLLWTPLGESAGENRNWLKIPGIGISIQPSEFVRVSFIMTFAKHLSVIRDNINKPRYLIPLLIHAGAVIGIILLTGDLGMALVFVGIACVMMYCAGLSLWYFLGGLAVVVAAFPFIWDHLATYQKKRILVGFNPDIDPYDKGLQQIQSRAAIAGGGFFGRGINGAGSYKKMYGCLTDFFFASYAEMFGFVGCLLLLVTMTVVVVRLIMLAKKSQNLYSAYVCAGVAGMIVVQTIENIGMCLCLLPVVGITLPLLSAGGSSVLSVYMVFGLVHGNFTPKSKYR